VEKELSETFKPVGEILRKLIDKNMVKALKLRTEQCKELIKTSELNGFFIFRLVFFKKKNFFFFLSLGVQSFTKLFDSLTDKDSDFNPSEPATLERSVSLLFTFSLIWSLGATLDEPSRKPWDEFVHTMDPSIPPQDTVYEYCVDLNKMLWVKWEDKYPIASWKPPVDLPYHRILVPTVDTLRHEYVS
jgi:dynein heavy chain